jgi:hypothetical protein
MLQPMTYARGTAVRSVELKVTTHTRSYWRGNSGVAMDGAGLDLRDRLWIEELIMLVQPV